MKHINIPVFIPHLGCPNTCAFCNQRKISGVKSFEIQDVKLNIDKILDGIRDPKDNVYTEIAFFGGSFTGLPRDEMIELLELVQPYLLDGRVNSLRCSTRPDYIDAEVIGILKKYGMSTIELGIQSMSDKVLSLCSRGHTSAHSENACKLIKESGISLVGQMMTGLPGSEPSDERYTAMRLCMAHVDAVRIYPTMVFAGTGLEEMVRDGRYVPPDEEDTIDRVADLIEFFDANSVPIIRIGLCSGTELATDTGIVAGGYEPAVGDMASGRVILRRIMSQLLPLLEGTDRQNGLVLRVQCAEKMTSAVSGHRRANRKYLRKLCGVTELLIAENPEFSKYDVKVDIINK